MCPHSSFISSSILGRLPRETNSHTIHNTTHGHTPHVLLSSTMTASIKRNAVTKALTFSILLIAQLILLDRYINNDSDVDVDTDQSNVRGRRRQLSEPLLPFDDVEVTTSAETTDVNAYEQRGDDNKSEQLEDEEIETEESKLQKRTRQYLGGLYPKVDSDQMPLYLRDTNELTDEMDELSLRWGEKVDYGDRPFFWHIPKGEWFWFLLLA